MEIKKEENVNAEYAKNDEGTKQQNEQLNSTNVSSKTEKSAKPKKSLKKWGIVGATLAVAGIVGVAAYVNYQKEVTSWVGGLESYAPLSYNNQFAVYFGTARSYSEFRSLVFRINAHNQNITEVETFGEIKIIAEEIVTYNEENKSYSVNDSIAKKTYFYTIEPLSYNDTGTIKEIKIEAYDRRQEE